MRRGEMCNTGRAEMAGLRMLLCDSSYLKINTNTVSIIIVLQMHESVLLYPFTFLLLLKISLLLMYDLQSFLSGWQAYFYSLAVLFVKSRAKKE